MKYSFTNRKNSHAVFVIVTVFISFLMYAYSTGITGKTLKNGSGCTCHNPSASTNVNVVIVGPDTLLVNQTATYTVKISGGPLTRGGTNIAASAGTLIAQTGLQLMSGELTHTAPKLPVSGEVTFSFSYQAPANATSITLYANGNSVNFNGGNDGDEWNFAPNKLVHIVTEIPVELTSFTANFSNGKVNLNWTTATEKNNFGFEIEKSVGSKRPAVSDWAVIGFVNGNGTTTEKQNYEFTDDNSLEPNQTIKYRLKQIDFDGSINYSNEISVNANDEVSPDGFALRQNYPNPFNPSTTINFSIPEDGFVNLVLIDAVGNEVAQLINEFKNNGSHSYLLMSNSAQFNLTSGVYFLKLNYKNYENSKSLLAVRKIIQLK